MDGKRRKLKERPEGYKLVSCTLLPLLEPCNRFYIEAYIKDKIQRRNRKKHAPEGVCFLKQSRILETEGIRYCK